MGKYRVEVPVAQTMVYLVDADTASKAERKAQEIEANGNRNGDWYFSEPETLWRKAQTDEEDHPERACNGTVPA